MTTVLRSGGTSRSRLFWSASLISATVLGIVWASGVDASNHQQVMEIAVTADSMVLAGLLILLWRVRKAFLAGR